MRCGCCKRDVNVNDYDTLYGSCNDCAFCASLSHFPCCHGECKEETPQASEEPSKEK